MPFTKPSSAELDRIAEEVLATLRRQDLHPMASTRGLTFSQIERTAHAIGHHARVGRVNSVDVGVDFAFHVVSISRALGVEVISAAFAMRSSVELPCALTTTMTPLPSDLARMAFRAASMMRRASLTLDPPNFCTTKPTAPTSERRKGEGFVLGRGVVNGEFLSPAEYPTPSRERSAKRWTQDSVAGLNMHGKGLRRAFIPDSTPIPRRIACTGRA